MGGFRLLLPPHLQQEFEIFIPCTLLLKGFQILAEIALHVPVASCTQQFFDGRHEFGIEVPREGVARVINQDAHEHDRIVLGVIRGAGGVAEILADAQGRFFGGTGARLGGFDDSGKVDEFGSLLECANAIVSLGKGGCCRLRSTYRVARRAIRIHICIRLAEGSLEKVSVSLI